MCPDALYGVQLAVEHMVAHGTVGGATRAARDRGPPPRVSFIAPVTFTYVDNAAVFALWSVSKHFVSVVASFSASRLLVHDIVEDSLLLSHLGALIDGRAGVIRFKDDRMWRVHLAGKELLGRRRVRGEVVRIWLGFVAYLVTLLRPGYAALWYSYALPRRP